MYNYCYNNGTIFWIFLQVKFKNDVVFMLFMQHWGWL